MSPAACGQGERYGGCDDDMKHGTRPTVAQKKLLAARRLNVENWLIERDTPELLVIVHRFSGQTRVIRKRPE